MQLPILYQDDSLIVVNKPHGLLSVPGRGADKQDCVASRVQRDWPQARVVHRLDCHTSGVMLMALGKPVQVEMSRQFHDRETGKEYIAVVEGEPVADDGIIELPMRCDIDNRPRQIVDFVHGKAAVTHWRKISSDGHRSRLLLKPVTGRSHQLRVHCQAIGHSIVGDRLYGSAAAEREERMLLHASSLCFTHPVSGKRLCVEAECEF